MANEYSLDRFEPLFVKAFTTDIKLVSNLSEILKSPKSFFRDSDYHVLISFIIFFFKKRNKIPSKDEILTYIKSDEMMERCNNAFKKIDGIDYESVDRELFYHQAAQFIKKRALFAEMLEVASIIEEKEVPDNIIEKFETICNVSFNNTKGLNFFDDIDLVTDYIRQSNKTISTGYDCIDRNIDGGLYEEGRALYMFMAPPNKGKSLFLGNIAANIAKQGKNVLVISLEMSEMAYAKRFCSQITTIPYTELKERVDEISSIVKSKKKGMLLIKEFPPSSVSVHEVKEWIKDNIVRENISIDTIVIDYLNLFAGNGDGLYEKIKNIAEQTRALSYYFTCPVISATQQNRSASGKESAGMNSIAESIGLGATADVILELYQNDEDGLLNIMRLGFVKNRYGLNNFSVATKISFTTLIIEDLDEEIPYTSPMVEIDEDIMKIIGNTA